jgi:hypothetical protein
MYRVTMTLNRADLLALIDQGRVRGADISLEEEGVGETLTPTVRERAKRGSRVNLTILDTLAAGPQPVAALKVALKNAGLAASSLPTGLSALLRNGDIRRVEEGIYAREAAQ